MPIVPGTTLQFSAQSRRPKNLAIESKFIYFYSRTNNHLLGLQRE